MIKIALGVFNVLAFFVIFIGAWVMTP